jgi:hypothetical protein
MGNRRAREFLLASADEADWASARTVPRLATEDLSARGIGARRMQLLSLPAFQNPLAFEVRQSGQELRLFSSRVAESGLAVRLVGCEELQFESARLANYFQRATELTIPLVPLLNNSAGADGTRYHFALFGDMHSAWRFEWWSEPPAQWGPLARLVGEMLAAFSSLTLPNSSDGSGS